MPTRDAAGAIKGADARRNHQGAAVWFRCLRSFCYPRFGRAYRSGPAPGLELRLIEAGRLIAKRKPKALMLLMATKRPSYFIFVSDAGTRPYPWKWQLHRSGEPMGVKLSEGGFISRSAAELAGTRALQQFLELLDQEEKRKR